MKCPPNGGYDSVGDAMAGFRGNRPRRKQGRTRLLFSSASLVFILLLTTSGAVAGQVTVVATELDVQKAGTILTVSSRFLATNHGDQPVLGVTVYSGGSAVAIGDIPPRGEVMSPPVIFALDLGGFDGRNFAFPVTVEFYAGDAMQSVPASFSCAIPE